MYLGLEDTHAVASWLGSQELLMDRIMSPEELAAALQAVTPQDIREVAVRLFDPQQARFAAIGPNVDIIAAATAA